MTYWLIMFQVPKSPDVSVIKYKISKGLYDQIYSLESVIIDCDKGNFTLTNKRIFSLEADNVACVVCDGIKNQRE